MKAFKMMALALTAFLAAACAEPFSHQSHFGTFSLTLNSAIGDITVSDIRISDSDSLLLQLESAVEITSVGKTLDFTVKEGIYKDVTMAIATDDGRTGLFTLKSGANLVINGGGSTLCSLTVNSLKDNSAAQESLLPTGRMFNMAIKAMALHSPDSLYCVYQNTDTLITSIKFVTESPSTEGIRIDNFDGAPAYATFNPSTGAAIISTSAKAFRLNEYPSFMFCRLEAVESIDFGEMHAPQVYKMEYMFSHCSKLKAIDLTFIENTEDCNSMDNLFAYCNALESLDISTLRTGKVTTMRSMFNHCASLKSLDLSHFDTSECGNMTYMFYYASNLEKLDLSTFKVNQMPGSKMTYFFLGTSALSQIWLGNNFYASDKASPTCFFASTTLAFAQRTGSQAGKLTIYSDQASADWMATTTLRWINSGYKNNTAIPVTFIDNVSVSPLTVNWSNN